MVEKLKPDEDLLEWAYRSGINAKDYQVSQAIANYRYQVLLVNREIAKLNAFEEELIRLLPSFLK